MKIMQKAVMNEYKIHMEQNLQKQKRYDDFVNLIENNSIDGVNVSPWLRKDGGLGLDSLKVDHGAWDILDCENAITGSKK
jgi:hypothetical protein